MTANGALAQATVLSVTASEAAASPPMAPQRTHRCPSQPLTASKAGIAVMTTPMSTIAVAHSTEASEPGRGSVHLMRWVAVRKVVMLIEHHHAHARATAADTAANAKHTVAATTVPGRAPGVVSVSYTHLTLPTIYSV